MTRINVHGTYLHVVVHGRGRPLLFVHGFPLDHTMWRPQIDAFGDSHRVIAPDLCGFGASDATDGTVTMEHFADDLIAVLDALAIDEPVVYCGLSMGGYVAWQFLEKYPDRTAALVLCDTRAAADSPEARENRRKMARLAIDTGSKSVAGPMVAKLFAPSTYDRQPEIVEATRRVMSATDPVGVAAALRGMAARPDMTDLLPRISVPTRLIVGEHDVITPPEEMESMARLIPGAHLVRIADAGHMTPLENPAAVNQAILEFLAGLD